MKQEEVSTILPEPGYVIDHHESELRKCTEALESAV